MRIVCRGFTYNRVIDDGVGGLQGKQSEKLGTVSEKRSPP